jgi:hypothetical protein
MKIRVAVFLLIFSLILAATVYAHQPIFERGNSTIENPVVVKDHSISQAIYGTLKSNNDIDFVKFNAKKGETFYLEMTVPRSRGNTAFMPYIALIGKGIYQKNTVPFKVEEGLGVVVIQPTQPKYFFEKFTQTSYNILQSIRGEIPMDGEYIVAIYSPSSGGKYALSVGEKEKFTLLDAFKFPYTYLRVKYFFSPLGTILGVIVFALLIYALYRFIKLKRRR